MRYVKITCCCSLIVLVPDVRPAPGHPPRLQNSVNTIAPDTISATMDVPDLGTRKQGYDWPDFLGPQRNSRSRETGIPTRGPWRLPLVWHKPLGAGYGNCTISRGRLFLFDRHGGQARLSCLHSETGKELWRFEYPTSFEDMFDYNNGPRSTPIVDGDRVYIYGAEGVLHCVRAFDGHLVWRVDTIKEYHVIQNFFGVGSTPLIEGKVLVTQVGGSPLGSATTNPAQVQGVDSGIVAFDKFSGQEKYRLTDELASYASPVATTWGNRRWCFSFSRGGLVAFEPAQGKVDFRVPWRAKIAESVNASTPVIVENRVLVAECYGPGAALLRFGSDGSHLVWSDKSRPPRTKAMRPHWNTPIYLDGVFYVSSGRHSQEAELRAVEAHTGRVLWSQPGLGRCSLLYVDRCLVCLSEDGTVRLLRANPNHYELLTEIVPHDGLKRLLTYPAWSAPVLSHGLLYLRGNTHLVCLELIAGE